MLFYLLLLQHPDTVSALSLAPPSRVITINPSLRALPGGVSVKRVTDLKPLLKQVSCLLHFQFLFSLMLFLTFSILLQREYWSKMRNYVRKNWPRQDEDGRFFGLSSCTHHGKLFICFLISSVQVYFLSFVVYSD